MGVHGLWRLLDTFGEVSQPEEWRGRRVAIDASIWIVQFRAQAKPGEDVDQRVLEGFFVRILKLFFYGIDAVFVFDGPAASSKAAERHRRQVRQLALADALVRRRARQIVAAQVASGMLNVTELSAKEEQEEEVTEASSGKASSPTSSTVPFVPRVLPTGSSPGGKLRRRRKIKKRKLPIAPLTISAAVTSAFLENVTEFIDAKAKGERCLQENKLKYSSSSLFMGPRRAVDSNSKPSDSPVMKRRRREASVTCVEDDDDAVIVDDASVVLDSTEDDDDDDVVCVSSSTISRQKRMISHEAVFLNSPEQPSRKRSPSVITVATTHSTSSTVSSTGEVDSHDDDDDDDDHEDVGTDMESASSSSSWEDEEDEDTTPDTWCPFTQRLSTPPRTTSEWEDNDEDFTPVKPKKRIVHKDEEDEEHSAAPAVPPTVSARVGDPPPSAWHQRAGASRVIPFELIDIVQLLDCCGVPYVFSPSEADAQCAFLAREGLVDAVFTEDSDVFVHGAPTVLRGFFATGKHVVSYKTSELSVCGVNKSVLVALALLMGCDYTEGVPGIGLVGALDAIVSSWVPGSSTGTTAANDAEAVLHMLQRWRALAEATADASDTDDLTFLQLYIVGANRPHWRQLNIPAGFPDKAAADAFYAPLIDGNPTPFPPCRPAWDEVRLFAAGRGLLSSSWVAQRFELARKAHTERLVVEEAADKAQRRLDEFGVRANVRERWVYKKQPPRQAASLSLLRSVQQYELA